MQPSERDQISSEASSPVASRRSWLARLIGRIPWRFVALLAGLGLLVYLVAGFGARRLLSKVLSVGPAFFVMPAIFALGTSVRAFGWRALLDPRVRPGLGATIASRIAATSLNDVLPLMGVGGEPSRLLWLQPEKRRHGTPALILDRVLLMVADAIFVLIASAVVLLGVTMPASLAHDSTLAIGVAVGLALALLIAMLTKGLAGPSVRLVRALGIKSAGRKLARAEEIDESVRLVWRSQPRRVLAAIGIHFFSRVLISAEVWVGVELLGVHVGVLGALALSVSPVVVSVIFAFIPSQLGIDAGSSALIFAALGLDPALGVTLALLQKLRQIVFVPIGFLLLSRAPRF
jgi:uncharacterized membrane protein YbhN (UPF0104 family)